MSVIDQFAAIKDTQHYKEWEVIMNQIQALQQNPASEPQTVNEKTVQRPNPFFPTNPFINDANTLFAIPSTQTASEEKSEVKKQKPVVFTLLFEGFNLGIRANTNNKNILVTASSQTIRCNASTVDSLQIRFMLKQLHLQNTVKHTTHTSLPDGFSENGMDYYLSFIIPVISFELRNEKAAKMCLSILDPYLYLHEDFQVVLGLWYQQLVSDAQLHHSREYEAVHAQPGQEKSVEYHVCRLICVTHRNRIQKKKRRI